MKTTILSLCLFGIAAPFASAQYSTLSVQNNTTLIQTMEEGITLSLDKREREDEQNVGNPIKRSIVPIPEVTMQGNTLHFVTACEGYEFRLVQGDTVCYSEEITGDTLTIPANLRGTYELQIVSENYIFFTEVTL